MAYMFFISECMRMCPCDGCTVSRERAIKIERKRERKKDRKKERKRERKREIEVSDVIPILISKSGEFENYMRACCSRLNVKPAPIIKQHPINTRTDCIGGRSSPCPS